MSTLKVEALQLNDRVEWHAPRPAYSRETPGWLTMQVIERVHTGPFEARKCYLTIRPVDGGPTVVVDQHTIDDGYLRLATQPIATTTVEAVSRERDEWKRKAEDNACLVETQTRYLDEARADRNCFRSNLKSALAREENLRKEVADLKVQLTGLSIAPLVKPTREDLLDELERTRARLRDALECCKTFATSETEREESMRCLKAQLARNSTDMCAMSKTIEEQSKALGQTKTDLSRAEETIELYRKNLAERRALLRGTPGELHGVMTVGITRENPKMTLTIGPINSDIKSPYYGAGERDVCFELTPGARDMLLNALGYRPNARDEEIQALEARIAKLQDGVLKVAGNAKIVVDEMVELGVKFEES